MIEYVYDLPVCLVFAVLLSTCEFIMMCLCTFLDQNQRLGLRNDGKHLNKRLARMLAATLIMQQLDFNQPQGVQLS